MICAPTPSSAVCSFKSKAVASRVIGSIDNASDYGSGDASERVLDASNLGLQRAVSSFDVAHRFTSAITYELPAPRSSAVKMIAGGWRKQGNHGKRHEFKVAIRKNDHPITKGMPAEFAHANDELYQNSVMFPESTVLATAFSDKAIDPKNTGKHEPVVWVATFGKGRVCENVLGHDVAAMKSDGFQALLVRGVEWAATGDVKSAR